MIVIDASATIHLLMRTPLAAFVEEHLPQSRDRVSAPELLDAEVVTHLRRVEMRSGADAHRVSQALGVLPRAVPLLYEVRPLISRAWQMRRNLTITDAIYVALAEGIKAPLLTTDKRLARGAAAVSNATIIAPP